MFKGLFKNVLGSNNNTNKNDQTKVQFGHYSDNNKPVQKSQKWDDAVDLFKKQSFLESIDTFFEYLKDDQVENVTLTKNQDQRQFSLTQGSKIIKGDYDAKNFDAQVRIAHMKTSFVPAMRHVLEQNFGFYYTRFALKDNMLCMRFNTDITAASANRLYYGLKELANAADKFDTTLIKQFPGLEMVDTEHVVPIDQKELDVKYTYYKKWIGETLEYIKTLKQEEFSNGILYLLLCLAYRIDCLVVPEGNILYDLHKLSRNYFAQKEDKNSLQQIKEMITEYEKLLEISKEAFAENIIHVKRTFALGAPPLKSAISDMLNDSLNNCKWYFDNNHTLMGQQILEYALTYCQFSYSVPKVISELLEVYMMIQYPTYFTDLGVKEILYNEEKKTFNTSTINQRIQAIIQKWKTKFPDLVFKTDTLDYSSLVRFQYSFCKECYNMGF